MPVPGLATKRRYVLPVMSAPNMNAVPVLLAYCPAPGGFPARDAVGGAHSYHLGKSRTIVEQAAAYKR